MFTDLQPTIDALSTQVATTAAGTKAAPAVEVISGFSDYSKEPFTASVFYTWVGAQPVLSLDSLTVQEVVSVTIRAPVGAATRDQLRDIACDVHHVLLDREHTLLEATYGTDDEEDEVHGYYMEYTLVTQ